VVTVKELGEPKPSDLGKTITDISDSLIYYSIRWEWSGVAGLSFVVYIHNSKDYSKSKRLKAKRFSTAIEAVEFFNRKVNE